MCKLKQLKTKVEELRRRIDLILTVKESVPTIQMLLSAQDYTTALSLLESTL